MWFDHIVVYSSGSPTIPNVLTDPGFETVFAPLWNVNSAARPSYLRANGGQVSMLTGQNGQATQTVGVGIPNTPYMVTAWCYVVAGTATLSAGSGGVAGTATAVSAWQQIAASGSSDGSGNLLISLSAGNTNGAYVDWDDVTVSAVEPANPVATWAQTFGYDGFGNLLSETPTAGSAPHLSINVDTATNRVVATGVQYDAAGNMIDDGTQAYTFDEANRLKTAGNYFYTYSGLENKRVIAYNGNGSTPSATINLYGPDGKRLGYYRFFSTNGWSKTNSGSFQNFLYLGNKALTYTEDRIGSTGNYFPYGNGYNSTGAEGQAFATYVQDESGLMYADQRFYNPGFGRFMTAGRSNANIDYGSSTSWNRYVYTNGDPVNDEDPDGRGTGTQVCGSGFLSTCSIENIGPVYCGNSSVVNPPDNVPIFFNMYNNSVTVTETSPSDTEYLIGAVANDLSSISVGLFGLVGVSSNTPFSGSGYIYVGIDSKTGITPPELLGEANAGPLGVGLSSSGDSTGFLNLPVGNSETLGVGTFVSNGSVGNYVGTSNFMAGFYMDFNNPTTLQQAINGAGGSGGLGCTDPSSECAGSHGMQDQ